MTVNIKQHQDMESNKEITTIEDDEVESFGYECSNVNDESEALRQYCPSRE